MHWSELAFNQNIVPCEFRSNYWCNLQPNLTHNICLVKSKFLPGKITAFDGGQSKKFRNNQIDALKIENSSIERIPRGISDIFRYLQCLALNNCQLKEISKFNLQYMQKLKHLDLSDNELEIIPGDLFEFNKFKINAVSFANNKLRKIGEKLFDEFEDFCMADFRDNSKIYPIFSNLCFNKDQKAESFKTFKKNFKISCMRLNLTLEDYLELKGENRKLRSENENLKVEYGIAMEKLGELNNNEKMLQEENVNLKEELEAYKNNINSQNDIKNLLEDENFKDFTFLIENEEFKVHKFIFMARSQLLREMILENPDADRLKLEDIPNDLFQQILDFVYSIKAPEDGADFIKLFAAASKLKIEKLRSLAAQKLIENLSADNSYDCLVISQKYDHQELKVKAFAEFTKEYNELPIELADDLEKLAEIFKARKMLESAKKLLKKTLENVKI